MRYAFIDWTDVNNPRVRSFLEYDLEHLPEGIKQENGYPVLVPSTVEEAPLHDGDTQLRTRTETITSLGHSVTWSVRNLTAEELEDREEQRRLSIEGEIPNTAMRKFLRSNLIFAEINPEEIQDFISVYEQYRVGQVYSENQVLAVGNEALIRVITPGTHTSQLDWNPLSTPSVYQVLKPSEGGAYPTWQDWGGNPANLYATGDRVTHNGQNWESKIEDNSFEPTADNWAAWLLLEDV